MTIDAQPRIVITGQFSDGSDRKKATVYDVTITNGTKIYFKTCNAIPTEADVDLSNFKDITPQPTTAEIQSSQLVIMDALADLYAKVSVASASTTAATTGGTK